MKTLKSLPTVSSFVCFGFACAAVGAAEVKERVLFNFATDYGPKTVHAAGANVTLTGDRKVVRLTTGHTEQWPGVTFQAPAGSWDLAPFAQVSLRLKNTGSNAATVYLRLDNPGADGTRNCVTGSGRLEPGSEGTVRVDLKRTTDDKLGGKLFGLRGYPVKAGGDGTVDPAAITQFLVFVSQPKENHTFELEEIKASGTYTPPTAWSGDADPFFPFIDTLGQYRHKDWPGKTRSVEELVVRRQQEDKDLAAMPGPAGWDKYGGWSGGPRLKATGFFRVEKHEGKWWLVDPEGCLFWSHGIDCVGSRDGTPIDERATWFEDFPGAKPEYAEFLIPSAYALHGHYAGRSPKAFSFGGANLKRKYGTDWQKLLPDVIHRRLRAWGLNTIANWSDLRIAELHRTPYTDAIGSDKTRMIAGSEGYWGKFPDVFDEGFRASLRQRMAAKAGRSAGDPWCLGYFSDNEMSWGDDVSLALAALASPPDQPAKQAFVADLRARYGEISKLNAAWGTTHANWEALLAGKDKPPVEKAGEDLRAFYTRASEQYFRTVRDVIKSVAPNQLYLGCRFAWVNARAAAAAAKYCDVVSYNLYQRSVAEFRFNGGADVPLIIGEFHFGALDRGMFHTGLVPVSNQEARAEAYTNYVQGALRHPQFVGCHWFQYQDEPTTGRTYDEENYQIGFVDVADTPYAETIAASRAVGGDMYRLRLGR